MEMNAAEKMRKAGYTLIGGKIEKRLGVWCVVMLFDHPSLHLDSNGHFKVLFPELNEYTLGTLEAVTKLKPEATTEEAFLYASCIFKVMSEAVDQKSDELLSRG